MHANRGANWRLWVLIIALLIVVAVLGFLCLRFFLNPNGSEAPAADSGLTTQVAAQSAGGKDVTSSIAVTAGTARPAEVPATAQAVLMDISWTGKREADMPLIITVSDPSFPDGDGLAVYHYKNDAWELNGTYLIENHAVSFQTDSLSPFAFAVASTLTTPTPAPTDTPEPTAEPTPTPEPTPEPIDYGQYNHMQVGEFVQATGFTAGGSYVIAMLEDDGADAAQGADGVSFFDPNEAATVLTANVLINYSGEALRVIPAEIHREADGTYTFADPIVEAMLWTADPAELYGGVERYALTNNELYLNLDETAQNVVMDDNDVRTRWFFGTVTGTNGAFTTLSYRDGESMFYPNDMRMVQNVSDEGVAEGSSISFPVSTETAEAKRFLIFMSRETANELDGTLVGTSTPRPADTPVPITGLDSTPPPTPTPDNSSIVIPVTQAPQPTAVPPVNTTTPPVQTEIPLVTDTPNNGGTSSTPEPGTGSDTPSQTTAPVPVEPATNS